MNLTAWPLRSKYRTVQEIRKAVHKYAGDLREFPAIMKMTIPQFFDFVKNIPYTKDMPEAEVVSRPRYLLTIFPALDCKKKSILFGSFMLLKYGPASYRFILSSNRPDGAIGHIFTQIKNGEKWINADCTYSSNVLGMQKKITYYEIAKG